MLELRNAHARIKRTTGSVAVAVGDLLLVHDANHPRAVWQLGKVEQLIVSEDGQTRGARVKVVTKGGKRSILKRPVQLLYPLEVNCDLQIGRRPKARTRRSTA